MPNGLKHFVRSPIKTAIEGDFDTGNVRFKARERYSFGFSDPRCVFGNGNYQLANTNYKVLRIKRGGVHIAPFFMYNKMT